jgi:hypothetical protein
MPAFAYPSRIRSSSPSPLTSANWAATYPSSPRTDRFRESSPPIAEEGLDAAEVAGSNDVGEAVMVDIAGRQGGIADVGPGRLDRVKVFPSPNQMYSARSAPRAVETRSG